MAAAIGIGLGVLQAGMGVKGLIDAGNEAGAITARGEYQQRIFNENADQMDRQAGEAQRLGEEQATRYSTQVRTLTGKQQSSYAGQGVDVGTGVSRDVAQETAAKGVQDLLTIRDNAWRTAFGYKQEANNLRNQGRLAKMGAVSAASSTLATGGLNFVNSLGKSYSYFDGGSGGSRGSSKRGGSAGGSYTDFSAYA